MYYMIIKNNNGKKTPKLDIAQQLKFISNDFVPFDYDSMNKYNYNNASNTSHKSFLEKTMSSFKSSKFGTGPMSPSISHVSLLYPSFSSSYRVLQKNKSAYSKMVSALSTIERSSLNVIYNSVIEKKKKLDYLRFKTKHSVRDDCKTL